MSDWSSPTGAKGYSGFLSISAKLNAILNVEVMHDSRESTSYVEEDDRIGWLLSALPALMLLFSGGMKLVKPDDVVKGS